MKIVSFCVVDDVSSKEGVQHARVHTHFLNDCSSNKVAICNLLDFVK